MDNERCPNGNVCGGTIDAWSNGSCCLACEERDPQVVQAWELHDAALDALEAWSVGDSIARVSIDSVPANSVVLDELRASLSRVGSDLQRAYDLSCDRVNALLFPETDGVS